MNGGRIVCYLDSPTGIATISHRIWVQFREGIAAGQRFRKGRHVFAVKLVRDPDETRRYLVCQCGGGNPMTAANALLKAIHGHLASDGTLTAIVGTDGIRDRFLARPRLPSVVFGEMETRDYSTGSKVGEEHFLTLEIWSEGKAGGRCSKLPTLSAACCMIRR